jgi:pyridinium-3,5-biscarboxylic acid mononucleotide sulfurtransferase
MISLDEKHQKLRAQLFTLPSLVVAYSGGVDSAYLLYEANEVLGNRCHGVIADSPSLSRHEFEDAKRLATRRGWRLQVIRTQELSDPNYAANPANRCYYCKLELFAQLGRYAREHHIERLAYGENADDMNEVRPGQQAAKEYSIMAPLRDAELTKADVRELSKRAGLPTSGKAAMPCLASRMAMGQPITRESLEQIERGEILLREAGFRIYRVRHLGASARIQVGPDELTKLNDPNLRKKLDRQLRVLGFARVEFDPEGYKGSSLR